MAIPKHGTEGTVEVYHFTIGERSGEVALRVSEEGNTIRTYTLDGGGGPTDR